MSFQEKTICRLRYTYDDAIATPHGFSTRLGGVSCGQFSALNLGPNRGDDPACVRENFARFCRALGVDPARMVFSRQVHGDVIRPVTGEDAGAGSVRPAPYQADGLITDVPGLALVVFTADCIPILLWDRTGKAAAAVHAGWRGTALGIGGKAAELMVSRYGCRREDILAAIGPGISACCFETDDDVPQAMHQALGEGISPFLLPRPGGKYLVDLKAINAYTLRRAGVEEAHISLSPHCTACLGELYWSHRRLGNARGSMAALIALGGKA